MTIFPDRSYGPTMTRIRGVLLAVAMVAGVTVGMTTGLASPADAYCISAGTPWHVFNALGEERVQASEPCNANGNYGGRVRDVQVGDGHCTYVYYRNPGVGAGWVQGTGCSTSTFTNYGAFGSTYEIKVCIAATGMCTGWIPHTGF